MAITAHFSADFADFFAKVLTAETQLEGLTRTSANVGASLQRMVDQFSGTRLIQQATLTAEAIERIGGASKLTAEELQRAATLAQAAVDKMQLTGQQVPRMVKDLAELKTTTQQLGTTATSVFPSIAGYLAGMFTTTALLAFGKSVLDFGNNIEKLANQTGMSYGQIQKLQYIAGQTGTSLDAMTNASQNLTEALGRGDSGVNGGVQRLGFHLDELRKMDPYDRMVALAGAIQSIEDPLRRAAAAREVFGKDWKELLPAILAGMQQVGDAAPVMSDRSIKAINTLNNAWSTFVTGLKVAAGEAIGAITAVGDTAAKQMARDYAADRPMVPTAIDLVDPYGMTAALRAAEKLGAGLNEQLIPYVTQTATGWTDVQAALDSVSASATETIETLKAGIVVAQAEAVAYAKWTEAMVELESVGDGWRGTLATINGEMVEAIKYYLDAGVAQGTLATAYGVTSAQVKAVAESQRAYAEVLKQVAAVESTRYSLKDIEAWGASAQAVNAQVMQAELAFITLLTGERAKVHANEIAALGQEGQTAQAITNQKIAAVWAEVAAKEAGHQSATAMDQEYRTAVETNALYAIQAITEQADAAMRKTEEVANTASHSIAAVRAAADAGMQFRPDLIPTAASLDAAAMRPGSFLGLSRGPMVQSMITPAANMPWNITINYPIMDDPTAKDKIAGLVGDAVMSRLTRSGGRY